MGGPLSQVRATAEHAGPARRVAYHGFGMFVVDARVGEVGNAVGRLQAPLSIIGIPSVPTLPIAAA